MKKGYRLLNQGWQSELEHLGNDFAERLNEIAWDKEKTAVVVEFGPRIVSRKMYSVNILPAWVEEFRDYDPREWNPYPEVDPPFDGFYRVQVDSIYKEHSTRFVWQWREGDWYHSDGKSKVHLSAGWSNIRFKTWDDPEPEGDLHAKDE